MVDRHVPAQTASSSNWQALGGESHTHKSRDRAEGEVRLREDMAQQESNFDPRVRELL